MVDERNCQSARGIGSFGQWLMGRLASSIVLVASLCSVSSFDSMAECEGFGEIDGSCSVTA